MKKAHAGLVILGAAAIVAVVAVLPGMGRNDLSPDGAGYVLLPENGGAAQPGSVRATDAPDGVGATMGREFAESIDLAVQPSLGGRGYVITPRSDADLIARHRMRVGDVLIDMDGRPLDNARIETLAVELGALDAVEVSYLRNGQMRNRLLTFDR